MGRYLRRCALAVLLPSVALVGCGSGSRSVAADPPACHSIVMSTIAQVAARAYDEVASGRLIVSSRVELQRVPTLTRAVATGDAAAAQAATRRLMAATQISFLRLQHDGRVLVNLGRGPAIAGATGIMRLSGRSIGRFVLAVQGDAGYAAVVHGLTGAAVLVRQGSRQLAGTFTPGPSTIPAAGAVRYRGVSYLARSFSAPAYPSGWERISLLAGPSLFRACAATAAQTVANVFGPLAVRIYAHESASHSEHAAVAYIERSGGFAAAVAAGNPVGMRAAIITFFRSHRHIVRVRVLRDGRVIDDVGGPYVLAPVSGTLRRGARVVGGFVTAIQDDAGYVALAHVYTGAQVILRAGAQQVPSSTLDPGPPAIPSRGSVTYAGRRYEAYSFDGQAFPAGTLRISLLVPISP
jgi:hypothetical protein